MFVSVEQINCVMLDMCGVNLIIDVVSCVVGISVLLYFGNGNLEFVVCGFVGVLLVMQFYDGVCLYGVIGVMFLFDMWLVDYIDVLCGFVLVIYGEGVIGGVVNIVLKKLMCMLICNELQVGGGIEGMVCVVFGSGGVINDKLLYCFDVSGNCLLNWVDCGDLCDLLVFGVLCYDVMFDLYVMVLYVQGFMYLMQYFGVLFVDGVCDCVFDKKNYNVGDVDIVFCDSWVIVLVNWQLSDVLNVMSMLYWMKSNCYWKDVEYYMYLLLSVQVWCSSYMEIFYDQE